MYFEMGGDDSNVRACHRILSTNLFDNFLEDIGNLAIQLFGSD